MKRLQKFCAVSILILSLTLSTFAGDMGTPGATAPPPPPLSSITSESGFPGAIATGDMSTPGVVSSLDPVTEAALSLLQSILSLF